MITKTKEKMERYTSPETLIFECAITKSLMTVSLNENPNAIGIGFNEEELG